jgi:hypothetical protein
MTEKKFYSQELVLLGGKPPNPLGPLRGLWVKTVFHGDEKPGYSGGLWYKNEFRFIFDCRANKRMSKVLSGSAAQ